MHDFVMLRRTRWVICSEIMMNTPEAQFIRKEIFRMFPIVSWEVKCPRFTRVIITPFKRGSRTSFTNRLKSFLKFRRDSPQKNSHSRSLGLKTSFKIFHEFELNLGAFQIAIRARGNEVSEINIALKVIRKKTDPEFKGNNLRRKW